MSDAEDRVMERMDDLSARVGSAATLDVHAVTASPGGHDGHDSLGEPVAPLDTDTAEQVARDVLTREDGRSVVWIGHTKTGLELADRVVTLDRRGTPR